MGGDLRSTVSLQNKSACQFGTCSGINLLPPENRSSLHVTQCKKCDYWCVPTWTICLLSVSVNCVMRACVWERMNHTLKNRKMRRLIQSQCWFHYISICQLLTDELVNGIKEQKIVNRSITVFQGWCSLSNRQSKAPKHSFFFSVLLHNNSTHNNSEAGLGSVWHFLLKMCHQNCFNSVPVE